jgi:serine/threonine-protein kinase
VRVTVPDVAGSSVDAATAALAAVGLTATVSQTGVASDQPVGAVAGTDPAGGSRVTPGTSVTLFLSIGPQAPPVPGPGNEPGPGPGQDGGGGHGGNKPPKH